VGGALVPPTLPKFGVFVSRFRNVVTGAVVSVADVKDSRFGEGWLSADAPFPKPVEVVPVDVKRSPGRPKRVDVVSSED
jgi:hypothetical protein